MNLWSQDVLSNAIAGPAGPLDRLDHGDLGLLGWGRPELPQEAS